jgi:hypothetical protein
MPLIFNINYIYNYDVNEYIIMYTNYNYNLYFI